MAIVHVYTHTHIYIRNTLVSNPRFFKNIIRVTAHNASKGTTCNIAKKAHGHGLKKIKIWIKKKRYRKIEFWRK